MKKIILILLVSFNSVYASTIVSTLPELKWVVDELTKGEKDFKSISLLSGHEDPHFVDATPGFIFKLSKAHLLVANGMELEVGWLPKVIEMAANSNIQLNSKGHCNTSSYVNKVQVVKNFDRSMGHVHPLGNPHFTLSLVQIKNVARKIKECLLTLEPKSEKNIKKNFDVFVKKVDLKTKEIRRKLSILQKFKFMTYHREFAYYFQDFSLDNIGTLEKIPGILPSAGHLYSVSKLAKEKKVKLAFASQTNPKKYLNKFNELTDIPVVQLPLHLTSKFNDYFEFHDFLSDEILKHVESK